MGGKALRVYEVAINPIPIIPITLAMFTVFSPRILPLNIKKAPINDKESPIKNWIVALFLWISPLPGTKDPFGVLNATNSASSTKIAPIRINTIGGLAM